MMRVRPEVEEVVIARLLRCRRPREEDADGQRLRLITC